MKLAPQYIEEAETIEEFAGNEAPSIAENREASSVTGRDPGRRIPLGHGRWFLRNGPTGPGEAA